MEYRPIGKVIPDETTPATTTVSWCIPTLTPRVRLLAADRSGMFADGLGTGTPRSTPHSARRPRSIRNKQTTNHSAVPPLPSCALPSRGTKEN